MKRVLKVAGIVPDLVTLACALIVVADLLQSSILSTDRWFTQANFLALVSTAFASLSISLVIRNFHIDGLLEKLRERASETVNVIAQSEYPDFSSEFASARSIDILSISGTKNANLGSLSTLENLFSKAQNKRIRILLANPDSEALKERYNRDEPETSEVGLEGLRRRLKFLGGEFAKLSEAQKRKVSIRVYNSYPTLSFVAVNNVYYWTVFGYKLRGSDCPKLVSEQSGMIPTFLARQFENIFQDATELTVWLEGQS